MYVCTYIHNSAWNNILRLPLVDYLYKYIIALLERKIYKEIN